MIFITGTLSLCLSVVSLLLCDGDVGQYCGLHSFSLLSELFFHNSRGNTGYLKMPELKCCHLMSDGQALDLLLGPIRQFLPSVACIYEE